MDPETVRNLTELLRLDGGQTQVLGLWEVLVALLLSLACSLTVAWAYRKSHQGTGYSQSFVQTLVIISLVTTIIMIVVGSNLARAFSLLGALSIIRFRNAVKETRDVGYIFFAMAMAMAAGTRFYSVAVVATAFIVCVILAFHALDYARQDGPTDQLLRVHLLPGSDVEETLGETLRQLFESYSRVRLETVQQGLYLQATLSVRPREGVAAAKVIEAIQAANNGLKVSYDYKEHRDSA